MKLKELKKGEVFTKKHITEPKDNQVWIKGDYDRTIKKYECYRWSDVNCFIYVDGNKEIYTEFIF